MSVVSPESSRLKQIHVGHSLWIAFNLIANLEFILILKVSKLLSKWMIRSLRHIEGKHGGATLVLWKSWIFIIANWNFLDDATTRLNWSGKWLDLAKRASKREVTLLTPLVDTLHPKGANDILVNHIISLKECIYRLQSNLHMLLTVERLMFLLIRDKKWLTTVFLEDDSDSASIRLLRCILCNDWRACPLLFCSH